MTEIERSTMARVTWRLLPFLLLLNIISWLDRVNVGFAKLQLNADLGFSETVYGIGAGVTPTCLFQLPHAIARGAAGASSFGVVMTGRNIGVFTGPLLLAFLIGAERYALHLGWTEAAQIVACMTLAAAVVAVVLGRSLKRS